MSEAPRPAIYCAGEQRRFPAKEFRTDPRYGLVHSVEPEHTTLGEELNPGGLVVLQTMIEKRVPQ